MCLLTDPGRTTLRRMSDPLFPDVDPRPASDGRDDAPPRYETANRDQIELQPCDLETLLPPGHAARLVWRFVEGLDLSAFYAAIRAREGRAGRPPIDRRSWSRSGSTPRWMVSAARAKSTVSATAMTRIAGCEVASP